MSEFMQSNVDAKKCNRKRFISCLFTTVEPEGSCSYFQTGGKKYYYINKNSDYWVTNQWKKL